MARPTCICLNVNLNYYEIYLLLLFILFLFKFIYFIIIQISFKINEVCFSLYFVVLLKKISGKKLTFGPPYVYPSISMSPIFFTLARERIGVCPSEGKWLRVHKANNTALRGGKQTTVKVLYLRTGAFPPKNL